MESKSLHALQVLSKIGKILSRIIQIISIVGVVIAVLGLISAWLIPNFSYHIGDINIKGLIETEAGMSMAASFAMVTIGLILCICEIIISTRAVRYFDHELEAGTPFTFEGAQEFRKLGILSIVLSLVSTIGSAICVALASLIGNIDASSIDISLDSGIGLGIVFIIVSIILKYGSEQREAMLTNCKSEENVPSIADDSAL